MIVLNFAHPLTPDHLHRIEELTRQSIEKLVEISTHFDNGRSFPEQIIELVEAVGLEPAEWQATLLLINPPALNLISVTLLAELHGRMGYFPPVVRLRPVPGALPPRFEVAEIINLQAVRETARTRR